MHVLLIGHVVKTSHAITILF